MSGFFSSEAERALMGGEEDVQLLFDEQTTSVPTPFVDETSNWFQVHQDDNGLDYWHPIPSNLPSTPSTTSPEQSTSRLLPTASAPSRSPSPNPTDLHNYGTLNNDNRTWKCAYPGCNSKAIFVRPCDLRKHYNRHQKLYFCRHDDCNDTNGFSSKKDRTRHEGKHNPGVKCDWDGCERIFSRVDNMRDHLKRIHMKSGSEVESNRA